MLLQELLQWLEAHMYVNNFSRPLKAYKSVIRSRLTDEHLQVTLRVATSNEFKPNIGHLADAKCCQLCSQNKI